ncbi:MAG: ABC transporter permease [Christensenellales bacterium]|jgi:ABC-type polysaccharide/polyol phosphate export permease
MQIMKRFLRDIKRYWGYTVYSAWAELKAEVISSYLSWIWLVLEPVCFMFIYIFVVKVVFSSNEPHLPVAIFIGNTAWTFFSRNVTQSVRLIKANRSIVRKTYLPKYVLLNEKMMINFFKMLISVVIIAGMMVAYRIPMTWNVLYVVPLFILLWLGTFAASALLLHFGTFVEDLSNLTTIVLRFLFYLSGVFFRIEERVPVYGPYLAHYNPMAFVIEQFRNILLDGNPMNLKWYVSWMIVSLLFAYIGIRTIYKYESQYAKVI